MYQIFAFVGYLASISVMGAGILFCVNRERFDELSEKISWETVKYYHNINNKIKRAVKDIEKKTKKSKKESENIKLKDAFTFCGYNIHTQNEFMCDIENLINKKYYIDDTDFDIMFIKKTSFDGEILWKRLENKEDTNDKSKLMANFEKIEKPFLQVVFANKIEDLENKPIEKTEIHNNLQSFYLKNNKILDETFVRWYMQKFHSLIVNNYQLELIDTNITIFKLNKTQHCILEDSNDQLYQIKEK